ncbi:LysR family transcriptional regulator [Photobacterium profundum]|uniref:Transcriptional regulator, LysR family protein n=1 Tax=Photobacterium profundum 3TCK TaxID=314280 RepID=Q1Z729_9GAMM|nr:LysR family transcriptional regulator [Photobacterium profundum]EAS44274.1 transcriptional regulator, LysR family protein [Photobacterium profundum 3TCK]PSV62967.1 LysR family transcriptional regulator [Photobacterium profundum]
MEHLDAIPYFLAVAKHESFAEAARHLDVSRSAVSKRVNQLETSLGVRLLHRTTRKVSLTEAGKHYLINAQNAYYWIQQAEDAATSRQRSPIGKLKVCVPMSFGRLKIAPLIPGFLKKYPQVEIDMVMDDRYSDIVDAGFDVAIRGGELADSSLIARKLMPSRSLICASSAYLDGKTLPTTPIDLTEHNALIYSYSAQTTEWVFEYQDHIETVAVRGNYRVNNSEAVLEGCLQGIGVGRLPDFIAKPYIDNGELIQLLSEYKMPEKNIWAVFPERTYMPVKVRIFIDYLYEALMV